MLGGGKECPSQVHLLSAMERIMLLFMEYLHAALTVRPAPPVKQFRDASPYGAIVAHLTMAS